MLNGVNIKERDFKDTILLLDIITAQIVDLKYAPKNFKEDKQWNNSLKSKNL